MLSQKYFSLLDAVKKWLFSEETFSFPLTEEEAILYSQNKEKPNHTRLSYACHNWYIHQDDSKEQIHNLIEETFSKYQEYWDKGKYTHFISGDTIEACEVYREAVILLVYSGVASLVTAGDWEVDRLRSAEEALGLVEGGLLKLESTVNEVYKKQEYIQKYTNGHRKGIHLHLWSGSGYLPHYLAGSWSLKQYSVADKLYFSWEPILRSILWRYLIEHTPEEASLILQVVKSLCEHRFRKIAYNTCTTLWEEGMLHWEMVLPFLDINLFRRILFDIKWNIAQALSGISVNPEQEVLPSSPTWHIKTSSIHQDDSSLALTLDNKQMIWAFLHSMPLESPISNFNELPEIYFHNLFLGDFLNVPNMISENVRLITSVRSDSHQKTLEFLTSTLQNIKKLDLGGVYITDGGRESYTNYNRHGELKEAIDETCNDIESVILQDSQTGHQHIVMQKVHPTSPLLDIFRSEWISTSDIVDRKRFIKVT